MQSFLSISANLFSRLFRTSCESFRSCFGRSSENQLSSDEDCSRLIDENTATSAPRARAEECNRLYSGESRRKKKKVKSSRGRHKLKDNASKNISNADEIVTSPPLQARDAKSRKFSINNSKRKQTALNGQAGSRSKGHASEKSPSAEGSDTPLRPERSTAESNQNSSLVHTSKREEIIQNGQLRNGSEGTMSEYFSNVEERGVYPLIPQNELNSEVRNMQVKNWLESNVLENSPEIEERELPPPIPPKRSKLSARRHGVSYDESEQENLLQKIERLQRQQKIITQRSISVPVNQESNLLASEVVETYQPCTKCYQHKVRKFSLPDLHSGCMFISSSEESERVDIVESVPHVVTVQSSFYKKLSQPNLQSGGMVFHEEHSKYISLDNFYAENPIKVDFPDNISLPSIDPTRDLKKEKERLFCRSLSWGTLVEYPKTPLSTFTNTSDLPQVNVPRATYNRSMSGGGVLGCDDSRHVIFTDLPDFVRSEKIPNAEIYREEKITENIINVSHGSSISKAKGPRTTGEASKCITDRRDNGKVKGAKNQENRFNSLKLSQNKDKLSEEEISRMTNSISKCFFEMQNRMERRDVNKNRIQEQNCGNMRNAVNNASTVVENMSNNFNGKDRLGSEAENPQDQKHFDTLPKAQTELESTLKRSEEQNGQRSDRSCGSVTRLSQSKNADPTDDISEIVQGMLKQFFDMKDRNESLQNDRKVGCNSEIAPNVPQNNLNSRRGTSKMKEDNLNCSVEMQNGVERKAKNSLKPENNLHSASRMQGDESSLERTNGNNVQLSESNCDKNSNLSQNEHTISVKTAKNVFISRWSSKANNEEKKDGNCNVKSEYKCEKVQKAPLNENANSANNPPKVTEEITKHFAEKQNNLESDVEELEESRCNGLLIPQEQKTDHTFERTDEENSQRSEHNYDTTSELSQNEDILSSNEISKIDEHATKDFSEVENCLKRQNTDNDSKLEQSCETNLNVSQNEISNPANDNSEEIPKCSVETENNSEIDSQELKNDCDSISGKREHEMEKSLKITKENNRKSEYNVDGVSKLSQNENAISDEISRKTGNVSRSSKIKNGIARDLDNDRNIENKFESVPNVPKNFHSSNNTAALTGNIPKCSDETKNGVEGKDENSR